VLVEHVPETAPRVGVRPGFHEQRGLGGAQQIDGAAEHGNFGPLGIDLDESGTSPCCFTTSSKATWVTVRVRTVASAHRRRTSGLMLPG
jgi:hypothetical protein